MKTLPERLLSPCWRLPARSWPSSRHPAAGGQAYRYAVADTGDTIEIDWVVEEGYYLYRNKMSYASGSDAIVFRQREMPEGEDHEDEFFGKQQIYRDPLLRQHSRTPSSVMLPETVDVVIKSQGCNEPIGLCFPAADLDRVR